jgi:hypothetical protein
MCACIELDWVGVLETMDLEESMDDSRTIRKCVDNYLLLKQCKKQMQVKCALILRVD